MKLEWLDHGKCREIGGDVFFPEVGEPAAEAKRICNGDPERRIRPCAVKAQCLAWALDNGERFGVYGGLSERERRALRQEREAA